MKQKNSSNGSGAMASGAMLAGFGSITGAFFPDPRSVWLGLAYSIIFGSIAISTGGKYAKRFAIAGMCMAAIGVVIMLIFLYLGIGLLHLD